MTCQICLSKSKYMFRLNCNHLICVSCAKKWFKKHSTCGLCRKETFTSLYCSRQTRSTTLVHHFIHKCWVTLFDISKLQLCHSIHHPNHCLIQKLYTFFEEFILEHRHIWNRIDMKHEYKNIKSTLQYIASILKHTTPCNYYHNLFLNLTDTFL